MNDLISDTADKLLARPTITGMPYAAQIFDERGNLLYTAPIQNITTNAVFNGPVDITINLRLDMTQ